MSEEIPPPTEKKKCPKCSRELPIDAHFCQSCQYSFSNTLANSETNVNSQWRRVKKRIKQQNSTVGKTKSKSILRTCTNCNAVVDSIVLEQCPLCMHGLPSLPPTQKDQLDRMLFTGKKLVSEKEMRIDRNVWTSWKEIFNVIFSSLLIFVLAALVDYVLAFQEASFDPELFVLLRGLINLGAFVTLGIYPFVYVRLNKLKWEKIGFKSNKLLFCILVGVVGGGMLYFSEYGIEYLMDFLPNIYLNPIVNTLFGKPEPLVDFTAVTFPLNLAFIGGFLLAQIMEEILFRGVLQNGIYDIAKKKKRSNPGLRGVLFTTLIYAGFNFFFNFSGYLLVFNLALSLITGILYELSNRSLTIVISAKTIYVGLSILFAFIPLL